MNQIPVNQIFRFSRAVKRDPAIAAWMNEHPGALGAIARRWFDVIRDCGDDVHELLHDGHPTACVADAAFAYVNAFAWSARDQDVDRARPAGRRPAPVRRRRRRKQMAVKDVAAYKTGIVELCYPSGSSEAADGVRD